MIDLYSGTPGSGKSLHIAKIIFEHIKYKDRPVLGNFDFNGSMCNPKKHGGYVYIDNGDLTPKFLEFFSNYIRREIGFKRLPEEYILLVIDEAQILFNAREWSNKNRSEWIKFFTQHRKLGYHIIMVAQFSEMLDKQIRSLYEYEYIHRKVANIGKGGKVLSFLGGGGALHVAVKMYAPLKMKVGSEFFRGNPALFSLYDSYRMFEVEGTGAKSETED